jgi:hypothetical protein
MPPVNKGSGAHVTYLLGLAEMSAPILKECDMENMIDNLDKYSRWLAYLAIAAAFAWIIIPALLQIWVTG